MLRPLDPALASDLASLPDELKVEIVRYTVISNDVIPIASMRRTTDSLISPFNRLKKLREVAEDEVMRQNVFSLDLRHDPDNARALWLYGRSQCPTRPFLRDVENLQLKLGLRLEGGKFDTVDDLFRSGWDEIVRTFRTLHTILPKLKTLDVQVDNRDIERSPLVGASARIGELAYEVDDRLHAKGCPHFVPYKKMERLLSMQKFLMLVGAVRGPKLTKRTVTFVQSKYAASRLPPVALEDDGFGTMAVVDPEGGEPTGWQKARAGLLFCEIQGHPKELIANGTESPQISSVFSKELLQDLYACVLGKADRKYLETILRSPRVVVRLARDG